MNNKTKKPSNKTEEKIINWSELSLELAKNSDSIRQNRYPKKYEARIQELLYYIRCWEQKKTLISPDDFKDRVSKIDLISVIMGDK